MQLIRPISKRSCIQHSYGKNRTRRGRLYMLLQYLGDWMAVTRNVDFASNKKAFAVGDKVLAGLRPGSARYHLEIDGWDVSLIKTIAPGPARSHRFRKRQVIAGPGDWIAVMQPGKRYHDRRCGANNQRRCKIADRRMLNIIQ